MKSKLAIMVLGIVLTVVSGCSRRVDPPARKQAPTIAVIKPRRGMAIRSITLPGDLIGYYQSTLYAKVTGYLTHIFVDKGDWVKKGQLLAQIEVPELRQHLDKAEANLAIQRITYDRLLSVWTKDPRLVAREDVDVALARFQEAQAAVEELKALVSYTQIIAPFTGVITDRFVDPGALIKAGGSPPQLGGSPAAGAPAENGASSGTPVLSEAMISTMRIYVYVPEGVVGLIHRGMPAILTVQGLGNRKYQGAVTRFATSLDLSTRTMLTEIDIKNPHHDLYPGMYANVTLELERHPNAIKLPDSAVASGPQGKFVYVVKGGRLQQVKVTTGIDDGRHVEITSGLNGSEAVVGTINPTLNAGEKVRPMFTRVATFAGALPQFITASR
jgi:membrane fusion protein, multidrug efflux system